MYFSEKQRRNLERQRWGIKTTCDKTKAAILAEQSKHPPLPQSEGPINYSGQQVHVLFVSFPIAELIGEDKKGVGYGCRIYRKESSSVPWKEWLKGRTVTGVVGEGYMQGSRKFA